MSDHREVLEKLQRWIRAVHMDNKIEPPPQADADAAITAVLDENERLHSQMYSSQPHYYDLSQPYYYDYWKKELARIEAALAIHGQGPSQGVTTRRWCRVCDDEVWPCPTVKALKGEE